MTSNFNHINIFDDGTPPSDSGVLVQIGSNAAVNRGSKEILANMNISNNTIGKDFSNDFWTWRILTSLSV